MIKAGSGYSDKSESIQAAKDAAKFAMENACMDKADWAMVFCTFPHRANYQEMLRVVCDITKTDNVSGCSAIGVLSNETEIEAKPGIVVLVVSSSSIKSNPFVIYQLGSGGTKAGEEIGELLKSTNGKNSLLTLLPDPFHIHPELLFKGIESKMGEIDIVGASASEDPRINDTFEFYKDTVASGAVSGMLLEGDFSYKVDITQGCQLIGPPCVITGSNKNIISELDGEPAFEVLKKRIPNGILQEPMDLLRLVFVAFPPDPDQADIQGSEYLVRNLIGVDPKSGYVAVPQNVKDGQVVGFTLRNPEMAREDLKQMLDRITLNHNSESPYRFGLYFNCCARGSSLYGHHGIDTAYISSALGNIPIIGFFGNSEFAPIQSQNHLFTYTGVLVLFSD
ncbi:MAG: FIST N-terminal domain-containing protein [Thermodesulfobacteriota bacterium]